MSSVAELTIPDIVEKSSCFVHFFEADSLLDSDGPQMILIINPPLHEASTSVL
jgi:hypothetical protein